MSEMLDMLRQVYRINDLIYQSNKKWYDDMMKLRRRTKILVILDRIDKK